MITYTQNQQVDYKHPLIKIWQYILRYVTYDKWVNSRTVNFLNNKNSKVWSATNKLK